MFPEVVGCEAWYCINLVENRVQWQAVVNTAMKIRDLFKAGI
jgi:hypothetical protein